MFQRCDLTPLESCMAFGIECGDGWYELISSMCSQIESHEKNLEMNNEWKSKEDSEFEPEHYQKVVFDQIKQKFGGLRVYYSGGDDHISGVISMAEEFSYKLCEVCGNKGKASKNSWIVVLCDNCTKNQ